MFQQMYQYQPIPVRMRRYYHYWPSPRSAAFPKMQRYISRSELYHNYDERPRFFHLKFDHMWNFSLDIG